MKRLLLCLFVLLLLCSFARADRYFCVVFSHDSHPVPLPHCSHVWGTFVRTDDVGELKQEVTISWAPVGGWHWSDPITEGYDMTLHETLDDAAACKRRVCAWGPFEIERDFYHRAEEQHATSGRYKCIDGISRRSAKRRAVNCIHRMSDLAGGKRLTTHVRYGKLAGQAVYKHFDKRGLLRETTAEDRERVVKLLSLGKYHLHYIK